MNQKPRLELKRRGWQICSETEFFSTVPMYRLGSTAPRKRGEPLVASLDENWRAPTALSLVSVREKGVVGYEETKEAHQVNGRICNQESRRP
jgi:hypothetical protein